MKMTSNPFLPAKSSSDTVRPSTLSSEKSGAWLPRVAIVLAVLTICKLLVRGDDNRSGVCGARPPGGSKAPIRKHQIPNKFEAQSRNVSEAYAASIICFLCHLCLFGISCLVLGILPFAGRIIGTKEV